MIIFVVIPSFGMENQNTPQGHGTGMQPLPG